MSKYIDAEKLRALLVARYNTFKCGQYSPFRNGKTESLRETIELIDSLQQDETQVDKMLCSQVWWEEQGWIMIPPDATIEGIDSLLKQIRKKLQQEQPEKRLIQVKCLYPYDESWQKNKVYTCEVWHHGDLNRDFWDVYYDYGKDPKYVQFPTTELLNEEFVIIQEESQVKQEQPELPGYDKALLDVKSKVDELYEEASIGLSEYDSGLYNGISETCMKLRGFIKARLDSDEQPEVDFETEYAKFSNDPDALDYAFPIDLADYKDFARHFYELGLSARKEESK